MTSEEIVALGSEIKVYHHVCVHCGASFVSDDTEFLQKAERIHMLGFHSDQDEVVYN